MKRFTRIEPTVHQDFGVNFKIPAVIKKFRSDDGLEHEFTVTYADGAAGGCVIALTPDNKVVTAHQFRGGPERYMYELPGGAFHPGEDPEHGARRELREETGYAVGSIELLGTSTRSAYTNERWYNYIAYNCVPTESGPQRDATEVEQGLEVRLITIDELFEYARTDQMTDPAAVLYAYERLKEIQDAQA